MKEVNLTCIECPLGCDITVKTEGDKVISVEGNSCPRGKIYAEAEVVCPVRVLTTTVKTDIGVMLPVKSNKPIKKSEIFNAIEKINGITVKTPIAIGDTVIKDIYEGIDIIATNSVRK